MNVITLSNDQLALVKSTLQKLTATLMEDMNAGGEWSDELVDLVNDRYDLATNTLRELEDCNTPKVVAPLKITKAEKPTLQETPVWEGTSSAAKVLGVAAKTLHNRKQTGKFKRNKHYKQEGRTLLWDVAALKLWFSENSH